MTYIKIKNHIESIVGRSGKFSVYCLRPGKSYDLIFPLGTPIFLMIGVLNRLQAIGMKSNSVIQALNWYNLQKD